MTADPTAAVKPPKSLTRLAGRAIGEFGMIRDGDRILLGLSGGKDSLSLLHVLRYFQERAPVRFELGVVTVDPQHAQFDPSPLKGYVPRLGLPYHYVSEPVAGLAQKHMDNDSYCSFCARMRRGLMYGVARREGYGVLALAQHLDDIAESFLMSLLFGGQLKTMKAHYTVAEGDLRVIRPLILARERQTRDFARDAGLPVIQENCPACFEVPTQRQRMKELLSALESHNNGIFSSIETALMPLLSVNTV
jgi:tRNA 2-thiocytidine biosynthesis protein TtcA